MIQSDMDIFTSPYSGIEGISIFAVVIIPGYIDSFSIHKKVKPPEILN